MSNRKFNNIEDIFEPISKHINNDKYTFIHNSENYISIVSKDKLSKPLITLPSFSDNGFFSMTINSINGFDKFYDIFPYSEYIDFEEIKEQIDTLNFLIAYGFGVTFNKKMNNIDDFKHVYERPKGQCEFISYLRSNHKIFFEFNFRYLYSMIDDKIVLNKCYIYRNLYIEKYPKTFYSFEDFKNHIINSYSELLNKKIEHLSFQDSKVLQMLIF